MNATMLRACNALLVLFLVACGGRESVASFEFEVLDHEGTPCAAMIVIDGDWDEAERLERFVHTGRGSLVLELEFVEREIEVLAVPLSTLQTGESAELAAMKDPATRRGSRIDRRRVRVDDPPKVLMILPPPR